MTFDVKDFRWTDPSEREARTCSATLPAFAIPGFCVRCSLASPVAGKTGRRDRHIAHNTPRSCRSTPKKKG
jgi:hypothetical protein